METTVPPILITEEVRITEEVPMEIIIMEVIITEATQLNPALLIFPSFCTIIPTVLGNLSQVG